MNEIKRSFKWLQWVNIALLLIIITGIYLYSNFSKTNYLNGFSPVINLKNTIPSPERAPVTGIRWRTRDGIQRSISQLGGKIVHVNYWAHWCQPCLREIPTLNELQKEFSKDQFEVLLLNVDNDNEEIVKAQKFLLANNIQLASVFKSTNAMESAVNLKGLPFHQYIDKKGNVAMEFYGSIEGHTMALKELLLQLLTEPDQ